ncbi:MAG: helix-turn-helix transcriptional regulator [Lachnospiraceae bacterium]|jgi:transcriptional regulator with XRE-family HTH domain|uniref:helix-turn-helix domain-containing protein n=1 Tax=uncultured Acetatifactor sp. TaxID=1671927 RepID=UPI0026099C0C|nr:helix-turn-helix transcriptional regulator [uncultured Acetatifactor sp.]MCI8854507.1 helix-turn-helix transcriptional regulator [Lachnospiraceae bacterium]MCI9135907.1 helix-turn-helix transcriptional regulator [Lachnospiraceae bacterium]
MYENLFYERLIKLRNEKGVSARDMSLTIGQSSGYINGLENRNGFPSMQVFFYICEYLGVTPSEFFDDNNNRPAYYKEIMEDLNALDSEQLQNIKAIIKGLKH